jgi:uncharacterized membrane protein
MFEKAFTFFFKYRTLLFEQGDLAFAAPVSVRVTLLLAMAVAVPAVITYTIARGRTRNSDRIVLGLLRAAVLGLLAFMLLRPALVLSTVVPQQTFLGVLIDDSRSMEIADGGASPRSSFVEEEFGTPDGGLLRELTDRFELRFYRFSSAATRMRNVSELTYGGTRTHLAPALERARADLAGVPLAGLVLVSDGADNSQESIAESLLALKAEAVPVFTVGLGEEELTRDIQLSRVETPRSVLKGASLVVDLVVAQNGYSGRTVPLQVEDEGQVVATQEVDLPPDGESTTVRAQFEAAHEGPRRFRFRIPAQTGESVTENNVQDALITVRNEREKVLYFEGEPRYEVGFLRRAVAGDENLQVVVLQRTAENKFLRLDVDAADELVGGFPRSREELFQYRGLILGSVEASFFTHDQLQMITDFVNRRGGGFLMLGGRHSFAEGGYGGTPVAETLPVVLDPTAAGQAGRFIGEIQVSPTRAGLAHPVTQIAESEAASEQRWPALPPLSSYNRVTQVKPGAVTLLTGRSEAADDQLVLAYQRYGRGRVMAFPIWDSWMWQFHADIPLEDMTHETFWRRLIRWLVDGVPNQVVASVSRDRAEPGEEVEISASVGDSTYLEVNSADVAARVVHPSGEITRLPLQWNLDRDGEYRAQFVPAEPGRHRIEIEAQSSGEAVGRDVTFFESAPSQSEYFDAGMRATLLRRIADETGGRFYTPDNAASIPEDITYSGSAATVMEEKDLWDMPILLVLFVALVGGEWIVRRARGLA